jgi:hypothetical protein
MISEREGSCSCGQLRVRVAADPIRVGVCHCLACQRRSGSAFAVQARFESDVVQTDGDAGEYVQISDEGEPRSFYFCTQCGVTVWFSRPSAPGVIMIPVGVFADPEFPAPSVSGWEERRHSWVAFDEISIRHFD